MKKSKLINWSNFNFPFDDNSAIETEEDSPTILMSSPMGTYGINDSMNPFRQFKFYMGNTNFTITEEVKNTLKDIEGVEVLIVLTRYRFILAPGRAFDWIEVKRDVEKILCGHGVISEQLDRIKNEDIKFQIREVVDECQFEKYWAVYVFPNGSYEYATDDRLSDDFLSRLNLFRYAKDESFGILITSEDNNE